MNGNMEVENLWRSGGGVVLEGWEWIDGDVGVDRLVER